MVDQPDIGRMSPLIGRLRSKVFHREETIRMVMLGSTGVGKTALIIRCLTDQFFNHYVPGKEMAYRHSMTIGPKKLLIDIMDSNGKNNALISYADAVVLVYSVTDIESFNFVKILIEKVRTLNLNDIPIIVIANKIDKKRQVSKSDAEQLSRDYDVTVFERSAAIPTTDISSVFKEVYKMLQLKKKTRRDSDPLNPADRMELKTIQRKSSSLDANDFIKLIL